MQCMIEIKVKPFDVVYFFSCGVLVEFEYTLEFLWSSCGLLCSRKLIT